MDAIRVLIVDDEPDLLETLVKRLNRRNLQATGLPDGDKGLEYLRDHDIDVVVLDVKMPGRDGLEILEEIRKTYPQIEVIMLTGHASIRSGERGMTLGAFDYIMKPVSIDELIDKIRQAWIKTRKGR
ncbi:response regulator [Desulfoplanes sp. PS50]|jgi:DNA-binding response OmpR family regulator